MQIKYANTSYATMLDQQTVQVMLCQGAKNETSSQKLTPLQQSQTMTQKKTLISYFNLQNIRAAMKVSIEV